jgi:chromate reductase
MSSQAKLLCFAGSLRRESYNKKLVKIAMAGAQAAGASVTYIDLYDLPMPVFNEDDEHNYGIPDHAKEFKKILKEHNAFLIAAPEYNSSISGALKNAIDWASRAEPGEKPLICFRGKVAGIMSASPGALGGMRGLVAVRSILENIGVLVNPNQIAIPLAHEAFDEENLLKDEKKQKQVKELGAEIEKLATKLNS